MRGSARPQTLHLKLDPFISQDSVLMSSNSSHFDDTVANFLKFEPLYSLFYFGRIFRSKTIGDGRTLLVVVRGFKGDELLKR